MWQAESATRRKKNEKDDSYPDCGIKHVADCCGGTSYKSYDFNVLGETVTVSCESGDGYDFRKKGSSFFITKDGKDVLEGYITFVDDWQKAEELVKNGSVEVIENTGDRIVWKADNKINSISIISGSTYGYTTATLGGEVTDELVKEAVSKLTYDWKVE